MRIDEFKITYDNAPRVNCDIEFPYTIFLYRYGDKYPIKLRYKNVEEVMCNIREILDTMDKEFNEIKNIDFSRDTPIKPSFSKNQYLTLDGLSYEVVLDKVTFENYSDLLLHLENEFMTVGFKDTFSVYKTALSEMSGEFKVGNGAMHYKIDFINHTVTISK